MSHSFFAILPDSLYEEFEKYLVMMEKSCSLIRQSQNKEKGNKYGMIGNTYITYYEKRVNIKDFRKN